MKWTGTPSFCATTLPAPSTSRASLQLLADRRRGGPGESQADDRAGVGMAHGGHGIHQHDVRGDRLARGRWGAAGVAFGDTAINGPAASRL